MKTSIKVATAIIVVLIVLSAGYIMVQRCQNNNDWIAAHINEGLIGADNFDITDEKTGSYAKGTVYYINENGDLKVRVFANVQITSESSWITIQGSEKLRASKILSNYGDDLERGYIDVVEQLGGVYVGTKPIFNTVPGSGGVIIDFIPTKKFNPDVDPLTATISVGGVEETYNMFLNDQPDENS